MIAKLPKETEEQIQRLIDSGEFEDRESVVAEAVAVLAKRQTQREHMKELLQPAIDHVERGEYVEATQAWLDQRWEAALQRYYAKLAQKLVPPPRELPALAEQASRDLDAILDESLWEWGPIQAARYKQRLDDALRLIVAFPEIGVRDDRLPPGFRVRVVGTHLICYRMIETGVMVYRILHQRQSPTGLFDDLN